MRNTLVTGPVMLVAMEVLLIMGINVFGFMFGRSLMATPYGRRACRLK